MSEVDKIAIVRIAKSIIPAANSCNPALSPFLIALTTQLSMQYGNIGDSAIAYAAYGIISCNLLQDVDKGIEFGQLALQVVSRLDAKANLPDVFLVLGLYLFHRKFHLAKALTLSQEGYAVAREVGDLDAIGYNAHIFCLNAFWSGQNLVQLERQVSDYCTILGQLNRLSMGNWCRIYWQSILHLLGREDNLKIPSGEACSQEKFEEELQDAGDLYGIFMFYLYRLMLCYLFGDFESATVYRVKAGGYLVGSGGIIGEPVFYFYDSLSILATLDVPLEKTSEGYLQLEENQSKLQQQWAQYAPMNHQHKVDLVEAEKCRVLGKKAEAIAFYDRAISGAQENEYVQEEALANELAAKFYLDWGKEKVAAGYMQEAYYSYARWGAKAKTEHLEQHYPQLLSPILARQKLSFSFSSSETIMSSSSDTLSSTTTGTGEMLDFASFIKAARILSQEIDLDRAIANLMQAVRENAGAETVVLMLSQGEGLRLAARIADGVTESANPLSVEESDGIPLGIVNTVKRTRQVLVWEDACQDPTFASDRYLQQYQPQSILCLPLVSRGQLIGILYLENNRVSGAFTGDRVEVLNLLCAQAAIALENAQLYRQAQQALTDLQQAQLQLVQKEKMATLGNLVAGVAHEINNPLGFIGGNVKIMRDNLADLFTILEGYRAELPNLSPQLAEDIEELDLDFLLEDLPDGIASMQEGVDRIARISTSLRTFSRADTDAKTEFNLHDGIDSTLLILKYRLKANEKRPAIEIVKNYGEIPEIKCYPGQLNQVFMNLLANAIDALEESNEGQTFAEIETAPNCITIRTEFSPDRKGILVGISDNGKGMEEEVKARLFEQGFTTKGVGKGTGLGMAIARQIIEEKHGGTILCESELGKGTEFIISLPVGR